MTHPARRVDYDTLLMTLDVEVESGRVATTIDGSLVLYKYTPECAFEKQWTWASRLARGLILDVETRRVIATPFPKFFNYGEGDTPSTPMDPLPDEPFEVTAKVDGSLAIIFHHDDRWRVATRGSFKSEQARWAEDWLYTHVDLSALLPGHTYLAEIVYAANRIVISYAFEGLVLLSAYNDDGHELGRPSLEWIAEHAGFRLVDVIAASNLDDLLTIAKQLPASDEGFVVRFQSGRRVKIKGDEYCRIHRLVSRVTPLAVWEMLVENDDIDKVAKQLPEEFLKDFDAIRDLLLDQFLVICNAIEDAVRLTRHMDDKTLGLWLPTQATYPSNVAKWIFPARKKNLLIAVHRAGDLRRRVFETFRPTGNRLEGYTPSSAMNRFAEETNA